MASLGSVFDANTVAPQTPFEVIPAGKYKAQIIDSDMRPTKDGSGQYLWLEMEILDGEYQGRKLWDRLNLVNNNPSAVEIAQRALSALCHAVGKLSVSESEVLHFLPFEVTVRVKPESGNYSASNEIRGYAAANGAAPAGRPAFRPAAQTAPAARPAAATPATNAAPWRRKTA